MTRAFALSAVLTLSTATLMTATLASPASAADAAKPAGAPDVPVKVDAAKGGQIAQAVCAACHGPDGNATGPTFPKLASQHAEYLAKELHNFKVPTARPNAIMSPIAMALSDTDIRNISAFYATQAYKPATAKVKETAELGQRIWRGGIAERGVPACASCHGPNGAGMPVQYPRLGGQWGEYNEAQLTAFKGGVRKNNAAMTAIASRLSEAEIKAVSDYAAGLR